MSPNPSGPVFLGGLLFLSLKDMATRREFLKSYSIPKGSVYSLVSHEDHTSSLGRKHPLG